MDVEFKIVNEGKIIPITGEELSLIKFVKKNIYQKYLIDEPDVPNKLAGKPYWQFSYRDILFSSNIPSFIEAFKANDLFEVQLIRIGNFINEYSHCTKQQVNELKIRDSNKTERAIRNAIKKDILKSNE